MADKCRVCASNNRKEMEREYVTGQSFLKISKTYNAPYHAVRNHMQNHLSRQMLQAYERKQLDESFDVLGKIDSILSKTELIFQRNFDKKRDVTALRAISEQRNILELLSKISYAMHQTRQLDIEKGHEQEQHIEKDKINRKIHKLSVPELLMLDKLSLKMRGETTRTLIHESWEIDEFEKPKPEVSQEPEPPSQKPRTKLDKAVQEAEKDEDPLKVRPIPAKIIPNSG